MYRFALPKRPRRWKHGAILTLGLLFTLLGFAPLRGGDVELQIPTSYARVKLPARAPTLVNLELPPGTYNVEPHSLGYFNNLNEFVYTADEPRGLIYARSGEKVVVVELQAPARAEEFMAQYLHRIRAAVTNLNARENELLRARQNFARSSGRAKQLASIPLSMNSVDLAQGFEDWCSRCAREGQNMLGSAQTALSQSASERNELKRLYYESEKADIELALRSFDLQIALARLPKPRFASVLGGGDGELVRKKVLGELELRQRSWTARRAELETQQRMDMQWLSGGKTLQTAVNALAAGSVPVMVASSPELPSPLDAGLRESIQRSRLALSTAEMEYVDNALAEANEAIEYVQSGGLLEGSELPHVNVARKDFTTLRVSDLENLTLVESSALRPASAANMLLELAQKFEKSETAQPLKLVSSSGTTQVEVFPREVGYGLLIVDRCRRVETKSAALPDGERLGSKLGKMLEKPADFGAAGNDLGYLEFLRWYGLQSAGSAEKLVRGIEGSSKRVVERR